MYHKSRSYDVWFLRYKVQRTEFFVILGYFCPFTSLTTQKIKILKKWKNFWGYYHFKHEYHKWKSYHVWFLRYGIRQTEFFLISDHFLPFYNPLPNKPEKQNLEKSTWRYHHFTLVCHKWQSFFCHLVPFLPFYPLNSLKNEMYQKTKCTKSHDHRLYCSSDMAHDECNCYFPFLVIWVKLFSLTPPSSPLTAQKMKISKKWKSVWRYHHKCTKIHDHMLHCSWDMACDGCNCYFSFGANFLPFYPLTAQKIKKN